MEHQEFEWKESWQEEHLKIICGFANAQGGSIVIGKDDHGKVVGLDNARKLLEDIPNKIENAMAIVADTNLQEDDGLQFITVNVDPYPSPISYRGRYYYRSGSTTQTLTGVALDEFILKKQGKTWDGVPVPYVKVNDLDIVAFREFRKKALASGRLTSEDLNVNDEVLIDNLILSDGNYLKRAAVLLFHEKPERWVPGAFVKIGYFATEVDLAYQDEIHGPLITMPDKIIDLIYSKYFKGIINYKGIQRIETFSVPNPALREVILNAIVHRDYSSGVPIQIKVYSNEVIISNNGSLPENWTVYDLLSRHSSLPHNPNIANVFFRSGMIEAWGRGIEKIMTVCKNYGTSKPKFVVSKSEIKIIFPIIITDINLEGNVREKVRENKTIRAILEIIRLEPTISVKDISIRLGISLRTIERNIQVLKKIDKIKRLGGKKDGYWLIIY